MLRMIYAEKPIERFIVQAGLGPDIAGTGRRYHAAAVNHWKNNIFTRRFERSSPTAADSVQFLNHRVRNRHLFISERQWIS